MHPQELRLMSRQHSGRALLLLVVALAMAALVLSVSLTLLPPPPGPPTPTAPPILDRPEGRPRLNP